MNNNEKVLEDSIFKIGRVISVEGRSIRVTVDKAKNTSNLLYKGDILRNVSVGGYVKIIKGFTRIVGKVEGEFVSEDKEYIKKEYKSDRQKINRVLNISLLGFFKGDTFERGIKELPLVDNECFLLHKSEFEQVHHFLRGNDQPVVIGTLALEKGQEISLGVNSLFANHIGIFGNTGSGKSYTLAKIYKELFSIYKDNQNFKDKAEFFFIDFNGEYANTDKDIIVEEQYKNIYKLSTRPQGGGDKFPIERDSIYDAEFWITFLEATEKTQTPFLRRAIANDYLQSRLSSVASIKTLISDLIFSATNKDDKTIEKTLVINFLSELKNALFDDPSINGLLADYTQKLEFHSGVNKFYYNVEPRIFSNEAAYKNDIVDAKVQALNIPFDQITTIDQIRLKIIFQYYEDIIKGFSNREHLAPLIKRIDKRFDDLKKVIEIKINDISTGKNITIVSLKDVNINIRKVLPLLLCKRLYNSKRDINDNEKYLNIIIDEAHNILSDNSKRESEQWKDYRLETFEEIIKEGRKFGVFLTIASQRPSDISATIISQLHNYFLHRLINTEDIKAVERTISYLDKVSFDYLPILPTGTCILAGISAQVPVVIDVGKIEDKYEPKNKTMTLTDKWVDDDF